ncbi:MAG: acyl-CoA dehydrogenase family protein [Sciscionella sp.]
MERDLFEPEHMALRSSFRSWLEKEVVPHLGEWDRAGIVPRELFAEAGRHGFLAMAVPESLGGGGVDDFRYNQVIGEEVQAVGAGAAGLGMTLHNDISLPYFLRYCTEEQRSRWLPGIASGELITAIAMTEPGIGSDLASMSTTAIKDGDHYVVNGAKTFITNGINADLVITAVKTDPSARHAGVSLLILERDMEGFDRGRNLDKIGLHSQDTAELFFNDVLVPADNLLGQEGQGFKHLMTNLPRERLSIAIAGVAAAQAALDRALAYTTERQAFGAPLNDLQTMKFRLAELATEVRIGQAFVDQCVLALNALELSAEEAAMAKWWCTELQGRAVDSTVQMHGGYGYMTEYAAARAYVDARITRIYGGTTEIMKEIIGRDLVKRAGS